MKLTKIISLAAVLALAAAPGTYAQTSAQTAKPAVKKSARPAAKKAPAAPVKNQPAAAPAKAQTSAPAVKPAAAKPAPVVQASTSTPFGSAVENLKSQDQAVRRKGADFLAQSRDQKAVPYLVKALADTYAPVRASAVDGLCQLVSREATPRITELLQNDKDVQVRQQAASSLSYMMDQSAGPALVKALKDDAPGVRYAAANTLGTIRYAQAEDPLIALLADDGMRRVAISALGQLQSKKAASAIFAALSDKDQYTRLEAVRALGSIGDASAAPELKKRLDKAETPAVRVEAALALAKLGMQDGLTTAYEFVKSADMSLKNQSLEVIGAVGDARSLQFIEELYAAEQDPMSKGMLDFTRQRLAARQKTQVQKK